MRLPEIQLDDRRVQELVNEARMRISRSCPEWTEHNVSDPGITLVELFAWMTDLTIYRLNRLPDKLDVALMELLGRFNGNMSAFMVKDRRIFIEHNSYWLRITGACFLGMASNDVDTGMSGILCFANNSDFTSPA